MTPTVAEVTATAGGNSESCKTWHSERTAQRWMQFHSGFPELKSATEADLAPEAGTGR